MSPDAQICQRLARRYELPDSAALRLEDLLKLLVEDPFAPTSVADRESAFNVHLADSLAGLEVERLAKAGSIVDIGSGAGPPGLVLAIALPGAKVHLLEAAGRKCEFLRRVVGRLDLQNVEVVNQRAETWAADPESGSHDAVTARAVSRLATLVEYASPLLRISGVLVAWKGRCDPEEQRAGRQAGSLLGMSESEVRAVDPYEGSRDHRLYVYEKIGPTPPGYPRRPGMAEKRPRGS